MDRSENGTSNSVPQEKCPVAGGSRIGPAEQVELRVTESYAESMRPATAWTGEQSKCEFRPVNVARNTNQSAFLARTDQDHAARKRLFPLAALPSFFV